VAVSHATELRSSAIGGRAGSSVRRRFLSSHQARVSVRSLAVSDLAEPYDALRPAGMRSEENNQDKNEHTPESQAIEE